MDQNSFLYNIIKSLGNAIDPVKDQKDLLAQWHGRSRLGEYLAKKVYIPTLPQNPRIASPLPAHQLIPQAQAQAPMPTATPTATPQQAQPTQSPTQQYTSVSPAPNQFAGYNQNVPQGDILNLVLKAAQENKIDPRVLSSLLWTESGYNPKAFNNGDYGIAQINLKSHPDVSPSQAYDPSFAIPWAAKYLSTLVNNFGDINRGVAAYNVGSGGARIQGPAPYGGGPKGQAYIDKIAHNFSPELVKQLGLIPSY